MTTTPTSRAAEIDIRPAYSTAGMIRIECRECERLLFYADPPQPGKGVEGKCRCGAVTRVWGNGPA
jgi:hypothetical protein